MGRSEGGSSAGAIAAIVVGGILLLVLLGCGGVVAAGFLFAVRSSPPPMAPYVTSSQPSATVDVKPATPVRLITNNVEGLAVIDGQAYTDDELRALLARDVGQPPVTGMKLSDDIAPDRRAAIEEIVWGDAAAFPPTPALDVPVESSP